MTNDWDEELEEYEQELMEQLSLPFAEEPMRTKTEDEALFEKFEVVYQSGSDLVCLAAYQTVELAQAVADKVAASFGMTTAVIPAGVRRY